MAKTDYCNTYNMIHFCKFRGQFIEHLLLHTILKQGTLTIFKSFFLIIILSYLQKNINLCICALPVFLYGNKRE